MARGSRTSSLGSSTTPTEEEKAASSTENETTSTPIETNATSSLDNVDAVKNQEPELGSVAATTSAEDAHRDPDKNRSDSETVGAPTLEEFQQPMLQVRQFTDGSPLQALYKPPVAALAAERAAERPHDVIANESDEDREKARQEALDEVQAERDELEAGETDTADGRDATVTEDEKSASA